MLTVPHRTPWTVGGILGSHAEPQAPAQGRLAPQAMLEPLPSVAVDCSSEHLPWGGTVERSGQRETGLGWMLETEGRRLTGSCGEGHSGT